MAPLLILALFSVISISVAQDRAHGLGTVSPVAISPQAYAFFNPNTLPPTLSKPCDSSHCSTLPEAATVQSTPAHESKSPTSSDGSHKLGAGGIAGISLSFLFVALVGMGVYRVVMKRKTNLERAKPEGV